MASMTIKGISPQLLAELKRQASARHRSLNGEILFRLEQSLAADAADPELVLARVGRLRARLALPALADDEFRSARSEGRP